jgi:hypothetical protein
MASFAMKPAAGPYGRATTTEAVACGWRRIVVSVISGSASVVGCDLGPTRQAGGGPMRQMIIAGAETFRLPALYHCRPVVPHLI